MGNGGTLPILRNETSDKLFGDLIDDCLFILFLLMMSVYPHITLLSVESYKESFKSIIGVLSWMAAQSQLWKFEWSEREIILELWLGLFFALMLPKVAMCHFWVQWFYDLVKKNRKNESQCWNIFITYKSSEVLKVPMHHFWVYHCRIETRKKEKRGSIGNW